MGNDMRWQPLDSAWWVKAVRKAGGSIPNDRLFESEKDEAVAQDRIRRALAKAEAEKARMQVRILMQKKLKKGVD